jgi:hypothetical protein
MLKKLLNLGKSPVEPEEKPKTGPFSFERRKWSENELRFSQTSISCHKRDQCRVISLLTNLINIMSYLISQIGSMSSHREEWVMDDALLSDGSIGAAPTSPICLHQEFSRKMSDPILFIFHRVGFLILWFHKIQETDNMAGFLVYFQFSSWFNCYCLYFWSS